MGQLPDTIAADPPVSILVVDDSRENRLALKAILSSPGYRLVEAGSGPEALRLLLDQEFAVLLIDVVMPEMSGFELASAIRQRLRTATVPILFLTGHASEMDFVHRGYEVGAVDYLVKPLVPAMVRAKVAVFAELCRQKQRIEEQARRLLEAERRESDLRLIELRLAGERHFRSLAEAIPHIIWTADPDGRVDYFNQQWFAYTGVSAEEAAGSWACALHPDDLGDCHQGWQQALRDRRMFQAECRLRRALDGAFRWHLCRAVAELGVGGQVAAWLGTFTDIEEQKLAELEQEHLHAKAVDALRKRDELLSVATHELGTPLSSLKLQLGMLVRPPPTIPSDALPYEQVKAKLELAERQVDRLSRLIADLMDVSRIRAGKLHLRPEDVDLVEVVRDVVARFEADAAKAGCQVILQADAPVRGQWDAARMEQVVTNLLTNAFKFGEGKPVRVSAAQPGDFARLVVHDQGIGVTADDAERIFQPFERGSAARRHAGFGLGLFIVRQILDAHGGTIRVESAAGKGATFIVDLPLARPAGSQENDLVRDEPAEKSAVCQ